MTRVACRGGLATGRRPIWVVLPMVAAACTGAAGVPPDITAVGGSGGSAAGGDPGGRPHVDPLACRAPGVGAPRLRLLGREDIERTLQDIFPEVRGRWQNALPANTVSIHGYDNDADAVAGRQWAAGMLATAESLADAVTGDALGDVLPCARGGAPADAPACAGEFVDRYGARLFRRALTGAERARYLDFFAAARARTDFRVALRYTLIGLVQSPHAVYRSELGEPGPGGQRTLTDDEIATALAYTFSGSTPGPELTDAARQRRLAGAAPARAATRIEAARALLDSARGREQLLHFFRQFLGTSRAVAVERPAVTGFREASPALSAEADAFFDAELIAGGGGVREFLTAPRTYPSRGSAVYQGLAVPGQDFQAAERPPGRGIGALAQSAFLATHSSSDASSPTRRGLFVYLKLLCQPHIEVPSDVPQLGAPEPGRRTTRQRYEDQHVRAGGGCASCHRNFDPLGFAFEHFDEGGRYRQDEGGLPIDSRATVTHPVTGEEVSFGGQEDLARLLAEDPAVHACLAHQLALYAFGDDEACQAHGLVTELGAGTLGLREGYARLAGEPHFSTRSAR